MPASPTESQVVLSEASEAIAGFSGRVLDVLDVSRPPDLVYAIHLSKVVSKLSPIIGNMIEYGVVSYLNEKVTRPSGKWMRQDPGFPDTIFSGTIRPTPGIEIKTWFPLATEITARFKDSISHFSEQHTNVAMLAWIPEFIIFGRPRILDVWVDSAGTVAAARDKHYHNPPDYLVFEPENTSARTRNLRQTNTNGYKFQGTAQQLDRARRIVKRWGVAGTEYSPTPEYQLRLRTLLSQFHYRLDTNFAKMDRIEHTSLEQFKAKVYATTVAGRTISEWSKVLRKATSPANELLLLSLIRDMSKQARGVFDATGAPKPAKS